MKKIHFALLAIVVTISACSKEQTASSYQEISLAELSTTVTTYVEENYPDASIVSALQATTSAEANFIVVLNTSEEIAFDASGVYLGDAMDYGAARHQRKGGPKHGGHGQHGGQIPGGIPVDSLPSNITSYISTNYTNARILGGRLDTTCQFGNVLNVMVRVARTAPIRLTFDLSGNYLFKGERALYSALPQVVRDTIAAQFTSTVQLKNKAELLTLANATIEYNVYLRQDSVRKIITISDNGTIVCIK